MSYWLNLAFWSHWCRYQGKPIGLRNIVDRCSSCGIKRPDALPNLEQGEGSHE